MFSLFTFSSMTCFSTSHAKFSASLMVKSSRYLSWSVACAPSDPAPIALALYCVYVPDGSEKNSCGPFSSTPASSNATPNGLLIARCFFSFRWPSPKPRARSQTDCVNASTPTGLPGRNEVKGEGATTQRYGMGGEKEVKTRNGLQTRLHMRE